MTLITKTIKGIPYYYLQDNVQTKKGNKTISTCVCRMDTPSDELLKQKIMALIKHRAKTTDADITYKTGYRFNNAPTTVSAERLEAVKLAYQQVKSVIQPAEMEEIEKMFYIRYVYGTTAIEGFALSEEDTAKVLETGLTPSNKPVMDVVAVNNYKNVKAFLSEYKGDVTEKLIKEVHSLLMYGMKAPNGKEIPRGEYRDKEVSLVGLGFTPPPHEQIAPSMRYLIQEYHHGVQTRIHPIELAAIFHQKFEEIHPFQDGNGRTGREILNFMLMKNGYPKIYITPEERSAYIDALEKGNQLDHTSLINFIVHRIVATMLYIYSKTGVNGLFKSKEVQEDAAKQGLEDVYHEFVKILDHLGKDERIP